MTIVSTDYRTPRTRKRKTPVEIPRHIVSARAPRPASPVIDEPVTERKRAAQPAAVTAPRIVTVARKPGRFGAVLPDMLTAEEHERRGDAAVALFRELVRRATWNGS